VRRVFITAIAIFWPTRVFAAPAEPSVRIEWNAPPPCPDREAFVAQVEAHLPGGLARPRERWIEASAYVERDPDGAWRLHLSTRDPAGEGERELVEPNDCATLAETAALVLAISIDPAAADHVATTEATEVEATDTTTTESPVVARARPDAAQADRETPVTPPAPVLPPLRGAIASSGGLEYGTRPRLAGLLSAFGSLLARRWRVELGVIVPLPRTVRFDVPVPGAGAYVAVWSFAAAAGPVLSWKKLEFPLLAGAEAGQILAFPNGLVPNRREKGAAWVALRVEPGIYYVPHRVIAIGMRVAGVVALTRPRFEIEGAPGTRYRPEAASVRASLVVEARFPGL
jgi:hypothetical protein